MTGHQINSLVGDLVAMAQAMEKLPQVQAENDRLQQASIADGERIARLELRLQERNEEITSLHQRIAEVTKERDDFGFRHLEEVDKTNALLLAIRNATGSLGQAVNVVDPPKAKDILPPGYEWTDPKFADQANRDEAFPEAAYYQRKIGQVEEPPHPFGNHGGGTSQPIPGNGNADPGVGERVADPTSVQSESTIHDHVSSHDVERQESAKPVEAVSLEGQSETLPMPSVASLSPADTSHSAEYIATQTDHAGVSEPLPYAGKRYYDEPGTISRERWLALGGTNESYDWRPWAQGEAKAHG